MIHNISRFIAALALLATAQGAWAEWTGIGSKTYPYIISTQEDLLLLAHRVNGTNNETANDYQGKYFKLGADITFTHAANEGVVYAENYEAIGGYNGSTDRSFKGDFDGDGHTVSGIRIRKTGSNYQGLFGYIGSGANIHDVHLTDARITGNYSVGGIVGHTYGGNIMRCSVTDSYITANDNLRYGTICGSTISTGFLTNNYYHGCTVNGTAVTSGKGCGGSDIADITDNNGALPAYRLDLGDGVTIQTTMAADLGFSCDADNNGTAENYWRSGAVLTLGYTGTVPGGYLFDGLTATNGTVGGNANDGYTLTMPDQDAAITAAKTPDPAHFSVNDAGTEYTILTATGWNVFCDCLNDNDTYNRFSGKTVQLGADITVTRMAGGTGHEFAGTFDGGGHTLTVNITGTVQGTAPFCEIKGATIRNLVVTGSVAGKKHSAGLVGFARGDDASVENTIENCLVATDVSIMGDDNGYLGGIVGHGLKCKLTIRGCAFTGSLTSESYYTGGLQGWSDGNTLILENDIFAASRVSAANVGFHPIAFHDNNKTTTATVSNVYYTVEPTCTTSTRIAAAGKQARTVAAAADVTIEAIALTGTATQYTVSGITAYSGGGLQLGETLYYGIDDQLSLTLTTSAQCDQPGYQYAYTASAGTLSGTTLTMPDQDVTISVNTAALAPIDWATVNQGNSEKDPYMIYNKDQLLLLAHRVNGTNKETANDYGGKYFKLGADITFTHDADEGDDYDENYEAIGGNYNSTTQYFSGTFDGDGHTVSGIRIRKTGSGSADNCQGLFGFIYSGADIHDVHLTDARIKGNEHVGGIAGYNILGNIRRCTVTDSYITATGYSNYGTICGYTAYTSSLTNNYYHDCTVNGTKNATNVGCCHHANLADITDNNGALPAYAITFVDGVSTTALASAPENGFVYNGVSYYREGLALPLASTLGSEAPEGYTLFSANGTALSGNTYTVNATDGDVTITAAITPDPAHFSVNDAGTEYTILTATGWNVFCDCLNDNDTYNHFSGKTVQLGADITVTRMAGGSNHAFTGTFDGGGHTLTLAYGTADAPIDAQFVAPLVEVTGGAKFTNLNIGGHIYAAYTGTDDPGVGGLIGHLFGGITIEDCTSTVTVNSTKDRVGGFVGLCEHAVTFTNCKSSASVTCTGSGSGFVGWSRASKDPYTIAFEGCLFDGKVLKKNDVGSGNGGFVGWTGSTKTVSIKNSLVALDGVGSMASSNSATFARGWDGTFDNSYYTQSFGTAQGKQAHTVAAGTDVTIDAIALTGTATQYTVSGITAYSGGGLQRGQTLYYGIDDQLSLTLSNSATGAPQGYRYDGYTASAGTLSGTTLTMPDEDVTISVNTAALAPIDWATVNQGNSADPYMIYNKDQLLLLAHRVNGTNGETANPYLGKYFKLGADITFSHDADEDDDYDENYEAIGGYTGGTYRNFEGNFDGDGHTVSGIRIRKTGRGTADIYQGLFGCISSGAGIYDVHLTDARIKGCQSVGGIVGYNVAGYIWRCSVTDSYITATGNANYGTICGRSDDTYRLRNNYYHGCTVNGTAATSGMGCDEADITANHGALPAYHLDLGANITTPPGTFAGQTEWLDTPPASARLAPENGFTLAGNHYFASGYEFTPGSTLASGAAQGYTPRATLGGQLLDLYTPTGNDDLLAGKAIARLTITADCDGKTLASTLISTREPITVAYIKADGTTDKASAIALDGHEAADEYGYVRLAAGTYYVGTDITYANRIWLNGIVTLILADGKTMTLNGNTRGIEGGTNLTIYGQSLDDDAGTLRYDGTRDGIYVSNYEQHSGNVSITTTGSSANGIYASDDVTLRGGTLTITADGLHDCAINVNTLSILGGQLDATATGYEATGIHAASSGTAITLGWTRPADRITASSISTYGGTVAVKDGQALTDDSGNIYTGTLTVEQKEAFGGKILQPCLALADAADNTAAITDLAGQRLAVALSGRTLYKDGSWNTLCLPFAVDLTASGTLSGDNVQAMTLNTTTSSFADGTLTLNFTAATETIPAGTPFIIKWDKPANYEPYDGENAATCSDLVSPVFQGVTIDAENRDATVTGVLTFTGTYAPVPIADGGDNTKLYLGAANKLYYPTKAMTIGTHRAYFQLLGDLTAGDPTSPQSSHVRAFNLNFGDDEATGIISVHDSGFMVNGSDAWYTLDGRRLDGQPTAKGLYIHGGKKVVIK